jgi:hypothetical protein
VTLTTLLSRRPISACSHAIPTRSALPSNVCAPVLYDNISDRIFTLLKSSCDGQVRTTQQLHQLNTHSERKSCDMEAMHVLNLIAILPTAGTALALSLINREEAVNLLSLVESEHEPGMPLRLPLHPLRSGPLYREWPRQRSVFLTPLRLEMLLSLQSTQKAVPDLVSRALYCIHGLVSIQQPDYSHTNIPDAFIPILASHSDSLLSAVVEVSLVAYILMCAHLEVEGSGDQISSESRTLCHRYVGICFDLLVLSSSALSILSHLTATLFFDNSLLNTLILSSIDPRKGNTFNSVGYIIHRLARAFLLALPDSPLDDSKSGMCHWARAGFICLWSSICFLVRVCPTPHLMQDELRNTHSSILSHTFFRRQLSPSAIQSSPCTLILELAALLPRPHPYTALHIDICGRVTVGHEQLGVSMSIQSTPILDGGCRSREIICSQFTLMEMQPLITSGDVFLSPSFRQVIGVILEAISSSDSSCQICNIVDQSFVLASILFDKGLKFETRSVCIY